MDPYPCNRVIANVLFKTSYLESWGNTKKILHKNKCTTGLMKIIEINSKEYGEDLLKKAGAKQ